MKLKVYRSTFLWWAGLFLLDSAVQYPDRNDGRGLSWHRYSWLLLLLAGALELVRAFRPKKSQPKP